MDVRHLWASVLVGTLVAGVANAAAGSAPVPTETQPTPATLDDMQPFAALLNEVSERRRRVVYVANHQSLFDGAHRGFVNVGSGNLSMARRDLVVAARLPIVVSRVYDSRLTGAGDFGNGGWRLAAAEYIHRDSTGVFRLHTASGAAVGLTPTADGFELTRPRPSDIVGIHRDGDDIIRIDDRHGLSRVFRRTGDRHVIDAVLDRHGNELRFGYGATGLMETIESDSGVQVTLQRDPAGRVAEVADRSGRSVRYEYGPAGRLRAVTDTGGHPWHYEYNAGGRLAAALSPDGQLDMAMVYDQSLRVSDVYSHGLSTHYEYGIGRPNEHGIQFTRVVESGKRSTLYGQNEDGVTVVVENAMGVRGQLYLDANNRVVRLTRDGDTRWAFGYGDTDVPETVVRHGNNASAQMYSVVYREDQSLLSIRGPDPASEVIVDYAADGRGFAVSRDGVRRDFGLDERGSLAWFSDAGSARFRLRRDGRGRIVGVDDPAGRSARFGYAADGTLSQATLANGERYTFDYDPTGLRSLASGTDGRQLRYHYTPAGALHRLERLSAGGQIVATNFQLDADSRLSRIVDGSDVHRLRYDALGNLVDIDWRDGRLNFAYDAAGRFLEVNDRNGHRLAYTYDHDEPDLRTSLDRYTRVGVSGHIDSGSTFARLALLLHNRTRPTLYGPIYLDAREGRFRLQGDLGIAVPGDLHLDTLARIRLIDPDNAEAGLTRGAPTDHDRFMAPSNFLFIPAEFWSLNCSVCPPSMPFSAPGPSTPGIVNRADTLTLIGEQLMRCGSGNIEPPQDCQLQVSGLPSYLCNLQQAQIGASLSPGHLNANAITWQLNQRLVQVPAGDKGPTTGIRGASTVNGNGTVKARYSSNNWVCNSPTKNVAVRANEVDTYPEVISLDACPQRQQDTDRTHDIDGCSIPPVTTLIFPGNVQNPVGGQLNVAGNSTRFGRPQDPVPFGNAPENLPCNNHDVCYQTCGQARSGCDNDILADMLDVCAAAYPDTCPYAGNGSTCADYFSERSACHTVSEAVFLGLELFGAAAYETRQVQYCDCCPP